MADPACASTGCSQPAARRCYFCPNAFCIDHITATAAGAICETCSAAEQQKQEQARQEQEVAEAQAKASGCLLLLATTGLLLLTRFLNRDARIE